MGDNFIKETYERYLNGETTLTNMLKDFNMSEYDFKKYANKHNLQYRREYLNSSTKHDFFDKIDSEVKAYLLGFYFADGCVYKNNFMISLSECDVEILEYFREHISPHRKITISKPYHNKKTGYISQPMSNLVINSKHLCETLEFYGMGNNKTTGTTTDLKMVPQEFMVDFIRGYFDGDGTICVSVSGRNYKCKDGTVKKVKYQNYNWSIISKKPNHLYIIKNFLEEKFSIHANILNDSKGNFLIEINRKDDFKKIMNILYEGKTYFLKRKHDKFLSYNITPDRPRVLKYKDGVLIKSYKNKSEAGRDEGITPQGIAVRIKKKLNINGYVWKYEDLA